MKQTVFTIAIVLVIVGLLVAVVMGSRGKKQAPIFFYGNTCPHCEDVEDWMKENKIEEKIEIVKKEVYDNRANSLELSRVAESCGLPTDSIGVPFLYTPEGKCLIGTPDIVGYLSDRAGSLGNADATGSGKEDEQ